MSEHFRDRSAFVFCVPFFRRAPSDPYKHPGPPAWTARTQASFAIPHATHCAFLTLPVWSRETFRGRSVTIEELECSILARPCTVPVCAVSRRNRDGGTRIVGAQRAVPRRGSSARNPRDSEPAGLRVSEREPPPETLSQAAQCRGALALSLTL